MKLHFSKPVVANYLILSIVGVVASWVALFQGHYQSIYGLPSVVSTGMLMWIPKHPHLYAERFYRHAWRLSLAALGLLLLAVVVWQFS